MRSPGCARAGGCRHDLLAIIAVLGWVYLALLHGKFWQAGPVLAPARPSAAPAVDVVVPARDEADVIFSSLRSLLAQDYAGKFASCWSTTAAPTAPARSRAGWPIRG